MDNIDLLNNDLQVTPQVHNYLTEIARWGKFLSIIGFICCGFLVILAFIIPTIYSQLPGGNAISLSYIQGVKTIMTIGYIILAVVLFFPCLYLYRFSGKMQTAIKELSQEFFDESFMYLKSMFKFYGILTIVVLCIYALIFITGIITGAMR